jgi:hypothetical protein
MDSWGYEFNGLDTRFSICPNKVIDKVLFLEYNVD